MYIDINYVGIFCIVSSLCTMLFHEFDGDHHHHNR